MSKDISFGYGYGYEFENRNFFNLNFTPLLYKQGNIFIKALALAGID